MKTLLARVRTRKPLRISLVANLITMKCLRVWINNQKILGIVRWKPKLIKGPFMISCRKNLIWFRMLTRSMTICRETRLRFHRITTKIWIWNTLPTRPNWFNKFNLPTTLGCKDKELLRRLSSNKLIKIPFLLSTQPKVWNYLIKSKLFTMR